MPLVIWTRDDVFVSKKGIAEKRAKGDVDEMSDQEAKRYIAIGYCEYSKEKEIPTVKSEDFVKPKKRRRKHGICD